jgi:hypothetical protein
MANWQPGGLFQWVRPLSLLKHTAINLGLAGFGWNQGQGTKKRLCFKDGKSMIFVWGEGGGVAFILQPDG